MLQCGAKNVNPLERFVSSLPVAAVLPELLAALDGASQVLLSAPTGAGKSTWLPLQLLAHPGINGKIILLEPRRLAARNVAQRLAELLNEKPGDTVGYRMRAQNCVGPNTRLEVVTEGVLTRMIQRDPELSGVGLVILDEFHERSLQADLALALLLDVQQGLRDDLKLLIMSATLDNDRLQQMLPEAPVVISEGRSFPVERRYLPLPAHQRFDEAVAVATAEMLRQESGSLLLFLPGVGEIQRVQEQLASRIGSDGYGHRRARRAPERRAAAGDFRLFTAVIAIVDFIIKRRAAFQRAGGAHVVKYQRQFAADEGGDLNG